MKSYFIPVLALGLLVSSVSAQDKPDLTNPKQKASYAIGLDIATSLKRQDLDVDAKALTAGIADGFAGKPALTEEEQKAVIMDLQKSAMARAEEKQKAATGTNLKAGEAFLAENAKKDGVKTTASGLQYLVTEAPLGIGGPAIPLLTNLGTQASGGASIPTNPSELGVLVSTESNLSILGQNSLSTGTVLPIFDPSLSGALNYSHQSTPEISPASYGTDNLIATTMNANAGLTQGFATGASAALAFNNSRNTINGTDFNYSPYLVSSLSLTVTQPLLRWFGRSMNRRYIRIAANQEKIAGLLFEQQLISTVYGVTRLYIDLASLRDNVRVKEEDLQLAEWLKREVVSRVEQGILPSIEVTRASAGLLTAQQALINARALLEEQEAVFKSVLFRKGLDDAAVRDARVVPTDALELPKGAGSMDAGKLVEQSLASRPDLLQAGLQAENTRIALEGSRNNLKPELDIVAFALNSGLGGDRNPGGGDSNNSLAGHALRTEQLAEPVSNRRRTFQGCLAIRGGQTSRVEHQP